MSNLFAWAKNLAMVWGGVGLFVVAFVDSSVLSLPEINDLLVILLVIQHKEWMLYYALMATLGSIAGCFVIYGIGRTGGEAWLRSRYRKGKSDRSLATFQRYGLLAVLVPAILPPPAPFKIFVLLAGVTRVRPLTFAAAVAIGRGARFLLVGMLAVWYGDLAVQYLSEHAAPAALVLAALVLAGGLGYIVWSRRRRPTTTQTATSDSSASG